MRISYSGLETFSLCPAKYKFQYIERIRTPKSKDAFFGTLIHECLNVFHNPSQPTPPLEEDILKYFTEKWDSEIYQDEQEEAFAFHQGVEILKNYCSQNRKLDSTIVSLETPFAAPLAEDKEIHYITGRVDRVDKLPDGSFEVIDYKTTKKMPSQEYVDGNLQLSVYHLGVISRWPSFQKENQPIKLSLHYLRHNEKLSTRRNDKQVGESKEKILSLICQIRESSFEPISNPLCDWCAFQRYCPLFRHKFIKEEETIDNAKIKEVIAEYFDIKFKQTQSNRRLGELKLAINQYCDTNKIDRVFGEDGQITRSTQKRFSYNFSKVKEILEPIGKWNEILTIDMPKFRKLIETLPYYLKKEIDQTKTLEREFKVISAVKKK